MLCKGIKRLQGDNTTLRLPITIDIMCMLKDQLHHSHQYSLVEKRLLWSAFTVAFYGFLRASKFTSSTPIGATTLTCNDIEFSPYILIRLRQSKTDLFRRGCSITLAATGTSTCPCKAICHYANLISPRNQKDPLFNAGQFSPLMREHLTTAIRQLLDQAGINSQMYASHSFRIRAATTAAAGLPAWLIRRLGRWSSNVFEQYIRTPPSIIKSSLSLLATTNTAAP